MNLESLKTASHIQEIMQHPNPMIMEAVKLYLSKELVLNSTTLGLDFIKIYLEVEAQMYAYLERAKREEESKRPHNLEDAIEIASEGPKFNI